MSRRTSFLRSKNLLRLTPNWNENHSASEAKTVRASDSREFCIGIAVNLSGKAMARTGLRMMPTFPSPPLKFRTASFPRYGFKAGMSDKAFPYTWFAIVLRAHCFHRVLPALCQGRCAGKAPPCERTQPLYPRGSRSGPGYAVPVHHHLVSPIRPTRGHTPTSPLGGLYEMPSLCLFA